MVDIAMLEKTSKTTPTIAILWPVMAIFEKSSATVEVDTFISPGFWLGNRSLKLQSLAIFHLEPWDRNVALY